MGKYLLSQQHTINFIDLINKMIIPIAFYCIYQFTLQGRADTTMETWNLLDLIISNLHSSRSTLSMTSIPETQESSWDPLLLHPGTVFNSSLFDLLFTDSTFSFFGLLGLFFWWRTSFSNFPRKCTWIQMF